MIDQLKFTMRAMQLFSRTQEITANNLANLNTPGFKKDKLFFHAFNNMVRNESQSEVITDQILNMEPGELQQTGNTFDFGIQGNGFFKVNFEGQEFLSRNGRFHLNEQGFLVDDNGGQVEGSFGPIFIPESRSIGRQENQDIIIEVANDGSIRINDQFVDKIQLFQPDDISNLERKTSSYLGLKEGGQIILDEESSVLQGFFESGNVNPMEEMLAMTTNMRLFESSQRNMRSTDAVMGEITTRLGRF